MGKSITLSLLSLSYQPELIYQMLSICILLFHIIHQF